MIPCHPDTIRNWIERAEKAEAELESARELSGRLRDCLQAANLEIVRLRAALQDAPQGGSEAAGGG